MSGKPHPEEMFEAGEQIIRAGEMATCAYLIKSGSILVYERTSSAQSQKIAIAQMHAGDIFGEMALIEHRTHKYAVEATEDTTVIPIGVEIFEDKLNNHTDPLIRTILLSALSRLSKTTQEKIAPHTRAIQTKDQHDPTQEQE